MTETDPTLTAEQVAAASGDELREIAKGVGLNPPANAKDTTVRRKIHAELGWDAYEEPDETDDDEPTGKAALEAFVTEHEGHDGFLHEGDGEGHETARCELCQESLSIDAAQEDPDGAAGSESGQEGGEGDGQDQPAETVTYRAVANLMSQDGRTLIRAGDLFTGPANDPRSLNGDAVVHTEPEAPADVKAALDAAGA